jgi:hypothetical protein
VGGDGLLATASFGYQGLAH